MPPLLASMAALEATGILWVLPPPDPVAAHAVCTLHSQGERFETIVSGPAGPFRWGYQTRDAAAARAVRFKDQLVARGWRPE